MKLMLNDKAKPSNISHSEEVTNKRQKKFLLMKFLHFRTITEIPEHS